MNDEIVLGDKTGCEKSNVAKRYLHSKGKPSTAVVVGSLIMYAIMLTVMIIIAKAIN